MATLELNVTFPKHNYNDKPVIIVNDICVRKYKNLMQLILYNANVTFITHCDISAMF